MLPSKSPYNLDQVICIQIDDRINSLFELKTRQNEEMSSSPEHASLEVLRVCTSYMDRSFVKNNFHWNDE